MSSGWSWFIIIGVTVNTVGIVWLLFSTSKKEVDPQEDNTTGHEWDGITELNNPLPKWWFNLFVITIVFAIIYLILYPGMGTFKGTLGWSQESAYLEKQEASREEFASVFSEFSGMDALSLSKNTKAMETGARIFSNYCSTCHGSDAKGAKGFPNLTDNDWLYGNTEADIKLTILNGRKGIMTPMGGAVGGENGAFAIAAYLTKDKGQQDRAQEGKTLFQMACVACHGSDGKGNKLIGSPNLMDDIWLHGGSMVDVMRIIMNGKKSEMPPHENLLSEEEVHILSAYVLSLSQT